MPLEFDATLKDLARIRPVDWVTHLDGPPADPVELLTPDLSTVSAFSDIVYRVGGILLHIEYQTGPDPELGARCCCIMHSCIRRTVCQCSPS